MKMKTPGAAVLLMLLSALVMTAAESGGIHAETTKGVTDQESSNGLTEMKSLLIDMKETMEAMEKRLKTSERLVEQLMTEKEDLAASLSLTVSQVEELRRERGQSRVSFSASLLASGAGNTGPFSDETLLIFKHVITNIGQAYNPSTGSFTAPVRGVYHFLLFVYGMGDESTPTGAYLRKNLERVVTAYNHQPTIVSKASNGVSLLLEVGDVVSVSLWPGGWVHDNQNHHTTFSGHLLFPM